VIAHDRTGEAEAVRRDPVGGIDPQTCKPTLTELIVR